MLSVIFFSVGHRRHEGSFPEDVTPPCRTFGDSRPILRVHDVVDAGNEDDIGLLVLVREEWQTRPVRRKSVADGLVADRRRRDSARSPAERVAHALALGRRDLELHATGAGVALAEARRAVERRRQTKRRPSNVLRALLA